MNSRLVTLLFVASYATSIVAEDRVVSGEIHFANDVIPILSRFGCNSSGCHGKAEGQNGFRLSVFGFDPDADFVALTQESRGRRVIQVIPEQSLLLKKISGGSPHGGGIRIARDSFEYGLLRDWIAAGARPGRADAPHVVSIRVRPAEAILPLRSTQSIQVLATDSDGREIDVTRLSRFQSNREGVAQVDEQGIVRVKETAGDVAIMAAYLDSIATFRALVPQNDDGAAAGGFDSTPALVIDQLVNEKLKKLRIVASPECNDATWLRRVFLDVIGRIPTPNEASAFLAEAGESPALPGADALPGLQAKQLTRTIAGKRLRLIDSLLQRPEFADYWALKWSDWLRVDRQILGHQGAYAYYKWIRDSIAANKPLDRFARELITAEGALADQPAGHFYKVAKDAGDAAAMLSQALLGIRIDCAKCHHHPFDRWSQDDYYGMQAFFTPVGFKATPRGELLMAIRNESTKHPRTGAEIFAHPLGKPMPASKATGDCRGDLADWLTSPSNPAFARNVANRIWAHFLGRGLIEPVDDVRSTNPATNPELLDALAQEFIGHGFDLHHLIRVIVHSRTYQASSDVNETNKRDEQNYSRSLLRRLDAEVLLDAICDATLVSEKFDGVPPGSRAVQLWDSQVSHYFLTTTGRPSRTTVCECERVATPSVAQVLHGLNSPTLEAKLSHDAGRMASLHRTYPQDDSAVVDELYLTFFSRMPSAEERETAFRHLSDRDSTGRRKAIEDIGWSLMNSLEFMFNH